MCNPKSQIAKYLELLPGFQATTHISGCLCGLFKSRKLELARGFESICFKI